MIPILFENSANTFTTNGLGRLADATRVIVTEERNGIYELEMDYPVTGSMFSEIQVGRIIVCTHDEEGDLQPFDIYEVSEPIDGIATFYAHHISYRLNEVVVAPFTATTCANAIAGLKTNSIGTNPFTFTTDKTVTADYAVTVPSTLRGLLGGQEGSLLDVYGTGEYKFDNFSVSLLTNRGSDTSVSIRYGKNLIEFENNLDHSEVYNAVAPYWLGSEYDSGTGESTPILVTLPEQYITANHTLPSGRTVIIPLDLSSEFETQPTVSQLRTLATSRLNDSDGWLPSQNITVNFVQLWQTDEYASLAPLQKVKLCDTVLVSVPMYNVRDLRIKVIKVVWNALLDRYDEMELGTPSATFATIITGEVDSRFDSTQQELNQLIGQLEGQIDAKIETWTQSTNPAANWTTQDARDLHNGDLWLYTGTSTITVGGVTIHPQGVYQYNSASNTWAAYSSTSSNLFDLVDGKTTIFYGTNTGTYSNVQVGDYLVDSTNGKTYRWNGSAWVLLLDYKTYTNGAVSDAKVARTEIQYCLSNSNASFVAYGSWSTTLPEYVAGKYYWIRTVEYYGDGTNNASTTVPRLYQTGQTAAETQIALESTNNHFWYDNTGAYVTEDDGTYSTGYATRITNAGILQSYNNNLMSSWTNSGINFYSSDGQTSTAEFGSSSARLGKIAPNSNNIRLDSNGLRLFNNTDEVGSLNLETDYLVGPFYNEDDEELYAHIPAALNVSAPTTFAVKAGNKPDPQIIVNTYTETIDQGGGDIVQIGHGNDIEFNFGLTAEEQIWVEPYVEPIIDTMAGAKMSLYQMPSGSVACELEQVGDPYDYGTGNMEVLFKTPDIYFGVGQGGENRGVYDPWVKQWIIRADGAGDVFSDAIYSSETTTNAANVRCWTASGNHGKLTRYASSSERYKRDIEAIEGAEAIYDIPVRQFKYRDDYLTSEDQRYDQVIPGFIAEELAEVYPIMVDVDVDGQPEDWNVRYIVPPMLKLIQEQKKMIDELEARIDALERK